MTNIKGGDYMNSDISDIGEIRIIKTIWNGGIIYGQSPNGKILQ